MIYAGIGSRVTPTKVCDLMFAMASILGKEGWTLRSGGSIGADLAFELGCDSVGGKKEIYLPWQGFNAEHREGCKSEGVFVLEELEDEEARVIASKYHPQWEKLSSGSQSLIARNSYQILGKDLKSPADLVICWTDKNKKVGGGTRYTVLMARDHDIPVVDFGMFDDLNQAVDKVASVIELITTFQEE